MRIVPFVFTGMAESAAFSWRDSKQIAGPPELYEIGGQPLERWSRSRPTRLT